MLFVDDDQSEIGVGKKQRRARTENNFVFVVQQFIPNFYALILIKLTMINAYIIAEIFF